MIQYHYYRTPYTWRHPAHRGDNRLPDQQHAPSPYVGRVDSELHALRPEPLRDQGPNPYVVDIEEAAERNVFFRNTLWTGQHLQVTLMSIRPGEDIGLEMHPNVDQFLRVEDGEGLVRMGTTREQLDFQRRVEDGSAIMIPAGTWHNVTNIGDEALKLYSIYAPPEHPHGTVHRTKAEAMAAEQAAQEG